MNRRKQTTISDANLRFDPETWVPKDRLSFPLHELAKSWCCSVQHLWNLVRQRELIVPQENIDRAKTRAAIQVPRQAYVDFLVRRSSPNFVRQQQVTRSTHSKAVR